MSQFVDGFNSEFDKITKHFKNEIDKLKAGRATTALVEDILIDSYGVKAPLKQVGSISIPEPSLLVIEPWDKNLLKEIEKALSQSNLDLSVSISETAVRGKISPLTEEKRLQIIKLLNNKKEESRVSLRQIRDKIKKDIEQQEKDGEISEDQKFIFQKELDEIVREKTKDIENLAQKKEEETMKV